MFTVGLSWVISYKILQGLSPSPSSGVYVMSDMVGHDIYTYNMLLELNSLFPV
jgi:hypothetical protein